MKSMQSSTTGPLTEPLEPTPSNFFAAWKRACEAQKKQLLNTWHSPPDYTAEIFNADNAVVSRVADEFNFKKYVGYYSLDAVFYNDDDDRVFCCPNGQTWVQNIRIAFEHENVFRSGLFQETSHLLITRADLRVLVSYPNSGEELEIELKKLARIISASGLGTSDPSFLFITGELVNSQIGWNAYTYKQAALHPLYE